MIICVINGMPAYPKSGVSIKITRENPFIQTSDSYTYDVTFPLSVSNNRIVFGNINRLDVAKHSMAFDECRLYSKEGLIIQGTGVITGVSNTEVKMQILSGGTSAKFNSKFKKIFLDRIDYGNGSGAERTTNGAHYAAAMPTSERQWLAMPNPSPIAGKCNMLTHMTFDGQTFPGIEGKFAFAPIYDDAISCPCNWPGRLRSKEDIGPILIRPAIQPNLIYVLHKVLETLGYTVVNDDINFEPWTRLYIANARRTTSIAKALPHWSADKFLDEVRNLFNITYIFDEQRHTVSILSALKGINATAITYPQVVDEFSSDYDDEAITYAGASNIGYNIMDSSDRDFDVIPEEVIKNFEMVRAEDYMDLMAHLFGKNNKYVYTHFYRLDSGYCYFSLEYDKERRQGIGISPNAAEYFPIPFGLFTGLIRDKDSDSNVELNIIPVHLREITHIVHTYGAWGGEMSDSYIRTTGKFRVYPDGRSGGQRDNGYQFTLKIPVVDSGDSTFADGADTIEPEQEDVDNDYVSVQDVLDGESADREAQEDDAQLPLMFVSKGVSWNAQWDNLNINLRQSFADQRQINPQLKFGGRPSQECWSMALDAAKGLDYIGSFHKTDGDNSNATIDGKNQLIIKFLTDDMPDPTKIYIFKNKRFVCAKIEIELTDNGINKLKTGYFYEIN